MIPVRGSGNSRWLALLLVAAILCGVVAGHPMSAAAQAHSPQVVVEAPEAGSVVSNTLVIRGWAVDATSRTDTGISSDSVQVWLGPAETGQLLGTAGYGDPRPDVAQQRGAARFLLSGFRFFWNSCTVAAGPQILTVTARSNGPGRRLAAVSVPLTIASCALDLDSTATGRLVTSDQSDAWTFEGAAGERVAITLDGYLHGGWDPVVELLAPDGTREDIDDDSGPDLDSFLTRRLAQTGRYTVRPRVFSSEGCIGDYVILGWQGPPGRSEPNLAAGSLGSSADFRFRGTLREFGERQAWEFSARAGDELILYVTRNLGSHLDPFVELYGPDGGLLAQDDDSGGGLNAFLQGVLPEDGTYTVVARSARTDCGGEYVLRIERGWGEQSALRGPLVLGETVTGDLSRDVRRDVWEFPATAGERVTLALETDGPARLQVAAPSGDWEQGRSSRGQAVALSVEPVQTGTYQAVLFVDTSQPIHYQLTREQGYGRLVTARGPVVLDRPVAGEIRLAGGRDLYTLEGRVGQQVRIALDQATARSPLDPYLELLGPDGRTVAEDDDSGGGPNGVNALIEIALPATGTYTIVARGFQDSVGPYVLTVNLRDGATPSLSGTPTPGPSRPGETPLPTPPRPAGPMPAVTPTATPRSRT